MGALIDLWPRLNVPLYATPFTAALFEARRAVRARRAENPDQRRAARRPFDARPVRHRVDQRCPFDPGIERARDPHARRHRAAYRRLEDRSDPACRRRSPTRRGSPRSATRACSRSSATSTNAVRDGRSPSEADVAKTLAELVRTAPGRVAVTTFASHVDRIRAVADAARAAGREVVVVGRAMERVVQVARETGYLDGVQDFRGVESYGYLPPDKVLALCTGSQGEPRAALARIAEDEHPEVTLAQGRPRDLFLPRHSRQREGGGARHQRPGDAGRRGHHRPHPSRARLRPSAARRARRYDRLGAAENPHSGAWRSAASCRTCRAGPQGRRSRGPGCRNGDLVRLAPGPAASSTRFPRAASTRTARSLVDADARTVASRRRLSFAGIVSVALALSEKGVLAADPEIELIGIPETDAGWRAA